MYKNQPGNNPKDVPNNFDQRHFISSSIGKAAQGLPQDFVQRLPTLLNLYLEQKANETKTLHTPHIGEIELNGNHYTVKIVLGAGDEGTSYLTVCDQTAYIVKVFKKPESVAMHVEETERVKNEGVPVIKIIDYDLERGILVLEGKLGVPFSFLLHNPQAELTENEVAALLNFLYAFKETHGQSVSVSNNLAINPENRGIFVFDLF